MRQEAERATDEVTEVAPNVLRMQLPIDMPGLGHVNCYALVDKQGVALVDPGVPGEESWTALLSRLKQAGIPLKRVHTAIVTHSHFDHFGGAARFARETGAQIVAHRRFTFGPVPTTQEPEVSVDDLAAHHRHVHGAPADESEDELP